MDFKNASLDELKQFVKEHKIKGVSALRKSALIEFLEKNYNGETDHTAEINEAKPQKADAEKKKRPGKTQKKGKTEHTDKSASPDQTVQVKNAEATEQQEKSEADVVKKSDRNKSENSQKSGEAGRRQHRNNAGRQTNRNGKRQERDHRSQGNNNRNNNSNRASNISNTNNARKDTDQENKQVVAEQTKQEVNTEKTAVEKSVMADKKTAYEKTAITDKKETYEKPVMEEKNPGFDTEVRTEIKSENRQENSLSQQESNGPELDSGKMAHGILEVMQEGYGFIRSANYLPGDQDIYVSPAQIRRFGLKTGDIITGNIRVKTQGEKFGALLYVASVNGESPASIAGRKAFEDLTPIFPNERINMDGEDSPIPIRMIDLLSPIGKGQRGMIVSPPKTGKTTLIKQIAKCISTRYSEIHLLVLLIDERPEEVTDIRESIEGPNVEVIYSTFDELPEHHKRVSEMVIERAKRLVEQKKDVVILLDSITRLARAYNLQFHQVEEPYPVVLILRRYICRRNSLVLPVICVRVEVLRSLRQRWLRQEARWMMSYSRNSKEPVIWNWCLTGSSQKRESSLQSTLQNPVPDGMICYYHRKNRKLYTHFIRSYPVIRQRICWRMY